MTLQPYAGDPQLEQQRQIGRKRINYRVRLDRKSAKRLDLAAARRRVTSMELLGRIARTVLHDDLIEAVLDDADESKTAA